jgi:aminopeptidase-like protein/aminoglycoside N3'-acetyltransferase
MTATLPGSTALPAADQLDAATIALEQALRDAGLRTRDVVMLHVNLAALGLQDDARTAAAVLRGVQKALGPDGTILVPTYTFSFCRQEPYDPATTPTAGGPWSPSAGFLEYFRAQAGVVRSADPIHSIAGLGPAAGELLSDIPPTCFGPDSVFARLVEADALICMLGLDLDEATIRHHTEEVVGVPFRFRKLFTGAMQQSGKSERTGWVYNVRILAPEGVPDGSRLARAARASGIARAGRVGTGELLTVRAGALHGLTLAMLRDDPWATAAGPPGDAAHMEAVRLGAASIPAPALSPDASMEEMIAALWHLPRDIVSDGYDAALTALGTQLPMTVHEFPSGSACWSWIVPEKWTCHAATLETVDGTPLFRYADHPLHVVSYSLPFDGEVTREELLRHLHVHPRLHDAVPFIFKYYERDWGLCCTAAQRDALTDPRYRVRIETSFSYGTLKVGEVVVEGEREDSIVLCAHLCHPAMVNDDLTGVVVGMDVMRRLLAGRRPRHTVRFLIVPETIGSVAYLSRFPERIAAMRGGLFLEMLGRVVPHALQLSLPGNTPVDDACVAALRAHDAGAWTAPFRSLAGNDERQFNAPGVRVPMLSLTRQLPPGHPDFPYREYHSSADTPEHVPVGSLEQSRDLVLAMLDAVDRTEAPALRYPGEACCSRYGLFINPQEDAEGHRALFDAMFLMDGSRTIERIADECRTSPDAVRRIVARLQVKGLLRDDSRPRTGAVSP